MKENLMPALKLTLTTILIFCVAYPLLMLAIAQTAPAKGMGEPVLKGNTITGYLREGQKFSNPRYFLGRPSAVAYNAAGSGGSNKGPSNPDYLKDVQARIDLILSQNPGISKKQIPAELVTASGSGIDPDISRQSAMIQVPRIARARHIPEARVSQLVDEAVQRPLLNCMGVEKINVLQLNLALDQMQ